MRTERIEKRNTEIFRLKPKSKIRIQHTKQQSYLHMVRKKAALMLYIPAEILILFLFSSFSFSHHQCEFIHRNENVNI